MVCEQSEVVVNGESRIVSKSDIEPITKKQKVIGASSSIVLREILKSELFSDGIAKGISSLGEVTNIKYSRLEPYGTNVLSICSMTLTSKKDDVTEEEQCREFRLSYTITVELDIKIPYDIQIYENKLDKLGEVWIILDSLLIVISSMKITGEVDWEGRRRVVKGEANGKRYFGFSSLSNVLTSAESMLKSVLLLEANECNIGHCETSAFFRKDMGGSVKFQCDRLI